MGAKESTSSLFQIPVIVQYLTLFIHSLPLSDAVMNISQTLLIEDVASKLNYT